MSRDPFASWADRLEHRRDRWQSDPVGWVENRLAGFLWSKQREIAQLVVDHKRVAVRSAHACGKTRLAASLACWWVDVHPPGEALVVSTAPSHAQIHGALWAEMRKIHAAAGLDGRIGLDDQWTLGDGTLVAVGRRPVDPTALQGYHRKYVLMIVDEACGVPAWMFTSAEAITTSPQCRIMAISNPDDASSEFARLCGDPSWRSVRISAFDSPAYTDEPVPQQIRELLVSREWVEDKRSRWTEESPLWRAKIEAEFADSEDGLIPMSWVTAANRRWTAWEDAGRPEHGRRVYGVDPAWHGRDRSAVATREGDIIRGVDTWAQWDTTQLAGYVQGLLRHPRSTSVVDVIGVGAGVVDQLRRASCSVMAFNGSAATRRRDSSGMWRFPNARSASYYNLRELLDPALGATLALPPDDDLTAELCAARYEPRSGGMLVVESKDEIKKRLGRSPDKADAVVYATWNANPSRSREDHNPRRRATVHRYTINGQPWEGFPDPNNNTRYRSTFSPTLRPIHRQPTP